MNTKRCVVAMRILLAGAVWTSLVTSIGRSDEKSGTAARDEPSRIINLTEGLVLPPVGLYGRTPIHQDALAAQIVAGKWMQPKAGDAVTLLNGQARKWARWT